jgi:hypothetical protein
MGAAEENATTSSNGKSLLNEEFDSRYSELAAGVVNMYHCLGDFLGSIDVLLKR